jgi:cation transport ATPase
MNLPRLQALIAPLSAPVPSALGVAVQAYLYFAAQSTILGWIAAVGAFLGIEAIGGASCYAVVKLHRQRNYGIEFAVSLAGILAYVGSGYFVLHNTAILIFFILAPFSYFAYAILRNMQDEHIEKMSETEAQVRLIEAQTKQINAETRKAKAGSSPTISTNPTTYKTYICPYCGVDQLKPQRYSVHVSRYCFQRPTNG